jgi:hypothetical protein
MTSSEYYNVADTEEDLTNSPAHSHLVIQLNTNEFYFVKATTQIELYHFNVSTGVETQIDIDPSNTSGDGKSRDHKIQSLWHDQANEIIYGVDCANPGNDFDVWSLDYSGSKTAPSVTEIGTSSAPDVGTVYASDIFMIGSNVYVIDAETRTNGGTVPYWVIWDVDTAPFTEQDTLTRGDEGTQAGFGVVIGNKYYTLNDGLLFIELIIYDHDTTTLSRSATLTDYEMTGTENQWGMAYDGSNILYLIGEYAGGDSNNYLIAYSISGDSFTVGGQLDVSIMLDRNVHGTTPPFTLEKAFPLTGDFVYQIPSGYIGNLHLISAYDFTDDIVAITDNFIIDDSGNIYNWTNQIASILIGMIYHRVRDYPTMDISFDSNNITILPNQFIQIIGPYQADGSTSANSIQFEGVALRPTKGVIQHVQLINEGSEMDKVTPNGSKSGRSDQIISDINDDTSNNPNYIRDGTLSNGGAMGTIILGGSKSYRKVVNGFADFDKFEWELRPNGQIDYNNGSVDSGADIRYDGSGNLDTILQLNAWDVIKYNKIIVRGAINPSTNAPYEGSWDDLADQQLNNINPLEIDDASLNTNALCTTKATSIGERESIDRVEVNFKYRKTTYGFIQPGQTFTFKYVVSGYISITEAQYFINGIAYDFKNEIGYIDAISNVIFVYPDYEETLPEQNSARIEQVSSSGDPDAIHDNVAGEINAITSKGTPVDADIVIIEDSAASWAKKKITLGDLPGGGFTPPIGFIAMFSGSWTDNSTIPGWYKCDGNNGTINLVNKFVRGGTTSGATGGSDNAIVVSHDHGGNTGNQNTSHNHSISGGNHRHSMTIKGKSASSACNPEGTSQSTSVCTNFYTAYSASHSHSVGNQSASHDHNIASDGSSGTNANIPAYYQIIFVQRIT